MSWLYWLVPTLTVALLLIPWLAHFPATVAAMLWLLISNVLLVRW